MFNVAGWSLPLVCAPMAYVGRARLARAVSQTGALGMMGFGSADSPQFVDEQFTRIPEGLPVGAAFMAWALDSDDQQYEAALRHRPAVVCLSFGDIKPWVSRAKDAGSIVLTQVGNVADIDAAIGAGVDGIVVRGMEAGGHGRNDVATLPLLAEALNRTDLPVLAGGGIATASGVRAVLVAGAVAAWVGTRFITANESDAKPANRKILAEANADDTVYTSVFDRAKKLAWPAEFGGRAIRTPFVDQWVDRLDELEALPEAIDVTPIYAGQGVGFCGESEPAAEIVEKLLDFH